MILVGVGCFACGVVCGMIIVSLCRTQSELSRLREDECEENTTNEDKIRKTEE